jgi:hypothetical protein
MSQPKLVFVFRASGNRLYFVVDPNGSGNHDEYVLYLQMSGDSVGKIPLECILDARVPEGDILFITKFDNELNTGGGHRPPTWNGVEIERLDESRFQIADTQTYRLVESSSN